ncbi:ParB/RepB/Spo0J family partition protein [Heyndrickxia ginsengihumi]|uniref:ParB/RepB/Spo0J family partition protein n=1 Tax=Heyndrickxia ginsengihumi TaxID=363870 RepID=A0A0A6XXZ6_9BACI|nr:ParB/RepB/Spo0J family partition protein [Heyndrickxia ginsengihumi]KHD84997.1 plasmid partitioning protein ParB [Heyndrickxia ginsengihumi]MBE6184097.1 ParB/RepB/Spo0J family partition protein [Bacillus sp. (in: firmicutes)]MCM3024161.1 ParB/RepB/Spo0J family partition protein [Heyndrickxia ginsengihumi]NEY18608.1 ParB/RepB/Spo0J family partition protein [Heyndrickxia ginsengihumi]
MAKGLGKGINALFANIDVDKEDAVREIKIKEIRPNPYQPRKVFEEEALHELKESILQHGILQPLILRKTIKGYEIVVGERRFRAAKEAKLMTVPAVVRDLTDQQMMELSVLENLQREDLNPIEEANAYQFLLEKLNVTQEELAKRLGKSRPYIANHLRILSLPPYVKDLMTAGKLSMGHGRTLLGLNDKDKMKALVEKTISENLSVRQLEKLVQELNKHVPRETKKEKKEKDIFIKEQENVLREKFGTTVLIKQSKKKSKIEIEFFSNEDLLRILEILDIDYHR